LVGDIPNWHQPETLMSREGFFLLVPRFGDSVPTSLPPYIALVPTQNVALTNISSSLVRQMIAEGRSLEGIVPPAVISHIIRNRLYLGAPPTATQAGPLVINEGKFIRFLSHNGWEYVERANCAGVVIIVPITDDGRVVLTEQYRIPVGKPVIEFPAGLVDDATTRNEETIETAASRELLEETGYTAGELRWFLSGPVSAGLTSEQVTFCLARSLTKRSAGGGIGSEAITIYEVPLRDVDVWLKRATAGGKLVDPKVYAGLYFVKERAQFVSQASI